MTVGVVSGFNRHEKIGGTQPGQARVFNGLLQTSAPINPGNSGGPLVDLDGKVIGVKQSVERPAQNIGFAIPVDTVRSTVAMFASHPGPASSTSHTGFIGVRLQGLDATMRSQLGYTGKGAAIVAVVGGSPADRAGLQPGQVIQSIDGHAVTSPGDVASVVRKIQPGKIASFDVWSGGSREPVAVHVGSAPNTSG